MRLKRDRNALQGQSGKATQPFHSYKWRGTNFLLQYQYNIEQAGDENKEKYQQKETELTSHQILVTYIDGNVGRWNCGSERVILTSWCICKPW